MNLPKPISRPAHGVIDYAYVAAVGAAPEIAGFADNRVATAACRILAGSVLASTLATRAEWGVVRVLPFKTHLVLDSLGTAFALAAPWLLGFADDTRARDTFLAIGAAGVVAVSLTDPAEMPLAG